VRCVSIENDGKWYNALCMIHAFPNEIRHNQEKSRLYKRAHLLEAWLKPEELPIFIKQIPQRIIRIDGEEITLGQTTQFREYEYLPSNNDYSSYPGSLYRAQQFEGLPSLHDPLLAYDLTFYPNAYEAIRHWGGIRDFHGGSDARIGSVFVFLPECRVRFESLIYNGNALNLSIKLTEPVIAGLRIKGAWQYAGVSTSFEKPVTSPTLSIDLPLEAEALEIHLIGPDETIYDYRRETRFWTTGHDRILQTVKEEPGEAAVRDARKLGEGEMVEFKPFLRFGDSKQDELIRTTIAFANTKGGRIFIGIDDDCGISGIEKGLYKEAHRHQRSPEQGLENYIGQLRQTIAGALNKTLSLEIVPIKMEGDILLLIEVPEGDRKPYAHVRTNAIYIRRGANNVVPDPDFELPQLLKSTKREQEGTN